MNQAVISRTAGLEDAKTGRKTLFFCPSMWSWIGDDPAVTFGY
ncbi:MAG TPA: hypothetical protein VFG63_15720 [Nocardioidaceae bacterium]|nr:hypothetical protein [Nocardioidaceae bacterium]